MAGYVTLLLRLGAELEQHRGAGHERRHLDDPRDVVPRALLVERPLVVGREPEAPVLLGEAHAGETAVVQHPLQLAGVLDLGELLLFARARPQQLLVPSDTREALGQPLPRPDPEVFDALDVGVGHLGASWAQAACARRAPIRWRCSVGVP